MYKPSPSHQKFLDILTEKNRPKKVASLMDEYLGDQKEYQKAVDDGFQGTYEEFLRMKSMRENAAQGGVIGKDGMFKGQDMGTREGFQDLIPGMRYDNLPESTKNKIIELGKTKPTAEIARDLQKELPSANKLNSISRTLKNFLKKRKIEPVEQLGGSSIPLKERLAKEKIIKDFVNKNPDVTNPFSIAKNINLNNPNLKISSNFVKTSFEGLELNHSLTFVPSSKITSSPHEFSSI